MFEHLLYSVKDHICTISLNRPDRYNAFNNALSFEFIDALKRARKDSDVRVIVLTGEGKAFCSGQDLKDIQGKKRSLAESVEKRYNPMMKLICTIEKPVICMLNGIAAGAGASIAIACDYTVASRDAALLWAFVNIGLIWDSGSSFHLPRLVGRRKAFEIATRGEKISAMRALELGLVNEVVEHRELSERVAELAAYYAKGATKAIGLMKRMLNRSFSSTLDEMLEQEKYGQEIAGRSEDYEEGVRAFIEKRSPDFRGK